MKNLIKRIAGNGLLKFYHWCKANLAALLYGYPAQKLLVIGITGTKGKSTTSNFIWAGLMGAGIKTGLTGTANIKIGERESLNIYHMTMPSPFAIQKLLRQMVREECKAVVLETTSQGIQQFRHLGVNYDLLVYTNLTPEHIESHGSFENYRAAKQTIFKELAGGKRKTIEGLGMIPKTIIANADSAEVEHFLKFDADKKMTYSIEHPSDFKAEHIEESAEGISYDVNGHHLSVKILGRFNVLNTLPVVAIAESLKLDTDKVIRGIEGLSMIPGRMETLQKEPYWVIVDYAHERESMTQALESARKLANGHKTVVLLGAEGGGRDKQKRALLGQISARLADYVVASNVDPYDDDPMQIVNDIAEAAKLNGKIDNQDLFRIADRREGIRKCLDLAKAGDVVIITGKGAEQSMILGGKNIPWDDRIVTREELAVTK